jgi:radical SAM superfamily enzyme YgiQ (UPF0313 family)
VDENLFLDKQWARKLAEALIPLRINWECYSDIGVGADKELLQLLYKSGCRQMQIGLESLSPVVLDNVSSYKASMRPYYEEYIQNIQAAGIQAIGMFIIGFDQDEFSLFAELDKFLETTSMFNYIVEWLTPVPGTKIFEELAAVGRIRDGLWEKEESISFVPLNISEAEMEYGTIWLSWQFAKPSRRQKRHKYFKQVMKNILRGTSKNSIPHKIT